MVTLNRYYSYNTEALAKGCEYCVRGEKLVLFVTGLCPRLCYFCPVSDQKIRRDVVFANERRTSSFTEVVAEAENMRAKGAGITGGDPLSRLDRTADYIKSLKNRFGKGFHIHLYTSLNLVTESALQKLYDAGLDEIRFHFDLDSKRFWRNLELAQKFRWDIGAEIPAIPAKEPETKELIDYIHDKVSFLNLNELEMADNSSSKLAEMGFVVKDKMSYAVKGSLETGLALIKYVKDRGYGLPVHLCTARLKDAIQLGRRIKREGKNIKKEFESVDSHGLLTKGALYLPELVPGFGYRKKLEQVNKASYIEKLKPFYEEIKNSLRLDNGMIFLDEQKPRILLSKGTVQKHKKQFLKQGLWPAVVVEYPTADQLEIEVEFLK